MKKKLSKNFSLSEFTKLEWNKIPSVQQLMFSNLANNILQPIRNEIGSTNISNGLRTLKDYHRLIKKGYNPSETSDHFFGNIVPVRSIKKIKIYGNKYPYSVGACDIVPKLNIQAVFKIIIKMVKFGKIDVGQVIYEKSKNSEWIHISNPKTLIYSKDFVKKHLRKTKILKSLNGGKSYSIVK